VENLRIHFSHRPQADWPLDAGVHRLVRAAGGTLEIGDAVQGALLAQFCVDARGLWLQVAGGAHGIHVNGRPVLRMALLRAGDAVYADGVELLIRGVAARPAPAALQGPAAPPDEDDPRIVLRGIGGAWHGRSFPLARACEVGDAPGADIRIDSPGIAARLWRQGDRVVLADLGSAEGILVNGVAVREALLSAGDQVAFGPQWRFVVEVPWQAQQPAGDEAAEDEDDEAVRPPPPLQAAKRWPWLLLAALLLGAALNALLLFGVG